MTTSGLIEQRPLLRIGDAPADAVVIVRGGSDSIDKLRRHALRTARAWSLDGAPFFGISVFAAVDISFPALLRARFGTFRTVHLTTAGELTRAFQLLPTGRAPHYPVRLRSAEDPDLASLLALLGQARENPEYGNFDPAEEA